MEIAFLGLGVMGYPMAGHLARVGNQVTVYNRTTSKAADWCREYAGQRVDSPAAAGRDQRAIFLCVSRDEDVEEVLFGPKGAAAQLSRDTIVVDHSTTSRQLSQKMSQALKQRGCSYIDAPISGGQAGAVSGKLAIMAGGEEEAYKQAAAIWGPAYAKSSVYMGPSGSGQLTKMVNQICITGVLQGLSEGVLFAKKAGLDVAQVVEAIKGGAAGSWQMENRAKTMAEGSFDFGFALELMIKDLNIGLKEAEQLGLDLPGSTKVLDAYLDLKKQGHGRLDTSALIKSFDS